MNTRKAWPIAALLALLGPAALAQDGTARPPAEAAAQGEAIRYIEVPLTGGVGEEITAPGIRNALNLAKQRRATHVIFVMDTPGGRVDDANAIARVLDEHRGDLKYIVVVKRCLSAGVWVMSRADEIFFLPQSTAGAAVAFGHSANTGRVEVDAKLNSALAAALSAAASARGQRPEIYRAMVIMDACLFAITEADGSVRLADTRPTSGIFRELDSAATVLSLTAALAAEIGFAQVLPGDDLKSIGKLKGVDMEPAGPSAKPQVEAGAKLIQRHVDQRKNAEKSLDAAAKRANELIALVNPVVQKARSADPGRHTYYVRESGTFTAESQIQWRKRTDEAVARWNDVLHLVNDISKEAARYDRAAQDINAAIVKEHEARMYGGKPEPIEFPEPDFKSQLKELARAAEQAKSTLIANRNKNRM